MDAVETIISTGINIYEATQLSDELSRLQATLPKARFLINRGEWGRFKNKDMAILLSQLKVTTYDAEDLLREFDDQALRQKMEDADRSWAEGAINSVGLSIEAVQHMPETSSVIGVSQVFGRDKERDLVIEKLGVRSMIGRNSQRDQVIELLGVPLTRGAAARAKEKRAAATVTGTKSASCRTKKLKGESSRAPRLDEAKCIGNVSVLPIFGIGGVGKSTLAQFIYNDPRVQAHFGKRRVWVCVSDLFDKRRITKEIIESFTKEEYKSLFNLDALQVELMEQLGRRKFLLVLDDIWPNANDEWESFYAPFKNRPKDSMILVTTRSPNVADLVATNNCKPIQLEGLDRDIFWEFFSKCAFGEERPESYPQLQDIGHNIASRLCGSPLAAKTIGRLLNMELTVQHWETVRNSELWELPHRENEILPALQLSYLYLPQELKRCFAFCCMFPKDYSFERDEIVDIWVAEGFVVSSGSTRLEDMGIRYLDDLRSRFLFQTDPKYPNRTRYVMHDLIHDMAQSVSVDECLLMQDLRSRNERRMLYAVRHMSVEVADESLKSGMRGIQDLNKLHSLRFGINFNVEITWFNQLSNILYLSLKGCTVVKLPESIGELNSLRYLDISYSGVQELPEKFWCLYSLQVVDANGSSLKAISPDVIKLINLRRLALPTGCSPKLSEISRLGNLSRLWNLQYFTVGTGDGRKIGELRGMNQLSVALLISSICNVKNEEEAAEASLVEKWYLQNLVLQWRKKVTSLVKSSENGVLEALHPPPRIEHLTVQGFGGDSFSPSWFRLESLLTLRSLVLFHCGVLKILSIPSFPSLELLTLSGNIRLKTVTILGGSTGGETMQHASSSSSSSNGTACLSGLTYIGLYSCEDLQNLDRCLSPEYLPSIKSIEIDSSSDLGLSMPVDSFVGFKYLQDLKIHCKLLCPQGMVLPPSLRRLYCVWP
uniref:NB-ARC domain-containing protein n=1 Tax=Oryza barthii TaxID=65489 RepID=A0A0D3GF60_9ORYZ